MNCIDYSLSFVSTVGNGNAPRFWVESRCRLIDDTDGTFIDYYQCGSCKSEHTFAEKNLLQSPNYDFLPVFGEDYTAIFRRHAYRNDNYVEYRETKNAWGGALFEIQEANPVQVLDTNEKILLATRKCLPIISQTEICSEASPTPKAYGSQGSPTPKAYGDANTQMRAIIECPVKTMNMFARLTDAKGFRDEKRCIYQVDTGPVLFPDLSKLRGTKQSERKIEAFSLAYVAFNVPYFADFVIEQPTPIVEGGKEVAWVYHYSGIRSLEAKNSVLCIGEL